MSTPCFIGGDRVRRGCTANGRARARSTSTCTSSLRPPAGSHRFPCRRFLRRLLRRFLLLPFRDSELGDAADQVVRDRLVERKAHGSLPAAVARDLFGELLLGARRRIEADVLLERGE